MDRLPVEGSGGEVGCLAPGVEDAVTTVSHYLDQAVGLFGVLVKVVVPCPYRMVEVEVAHEDGPGKEPGERCDEVAGAVGDVVIHVEHEEGKGGRVDLQAHEAVGGDDVGLDLKGPFGAALGDVHDDVWFVIGC